MNLFAFVILAAGLLALLKYVFQDCNIPFFKKKKTGINKITSLIQNNQKEEPPQNNVDTPYVYLTIYEDGKDMGDITVYLYEKDCPITTKNFKELCCSDNPGFGYKNSIIHRNVHNFMIQGGDFTNGNGTGGKSIYNKNFKDENFKYKNKKGSISMANAGPNTNGSQFFINVADNDNLDNKHVVFGRVIEGMELVEYINSRPVGDKDKPLRKIRIHDCGRIWLEESEKSGKIDNSDTDFQNTEDLNTEKYSNYLKNLA
jgi:peptidyl-prolyl cis-trans isomerase B (cyclophilin B)